MRSLRRVSSVEAESAASEVISPAPFSWKREGRKKVTLCVCMNEWGGNLVLPA